MIRVNRLNNSSTWSIPTSKDKSYRKMWDFFKIDEKKRAQNRFNFDFDPLFQAKELIELEFRHKCAFCEKPFSSRGNEGGAVNLRPPSDAKDFSGKSSTDHYWWLIYEWRNIYNVCNDCSRFKQSFFPVRGNRAKPLTNYEDVLRIEDNLLIDPCNDYPYMHLDWKINGTVESQTEKGKTTIEILKLNREDLVKSRKSILRSFIVVLNEFDECYKLKGRRTKEIAERVDRFIGSLKNISDPESTMPFLGIQRWYFLHWKPRLLFLNYFLDSGDDEFFSMEAVPEFVSIVGQKRKIIIDLFNEIEKSISGGTVAREHGQSKKAPGRSFTGYENFIIEKIVINNFKTISKMELRFPHPVDPGAQKLKTVQVSESWLMLLGENAVGKSSFLQALALALAGGEYVHRIGLPGHTILRHGELDGSVEVYVFGKNLPVSIRFNDRIDQIESSDRLPHTNLLAYGSTRLLPTKKIRPEASRGIVRAMNLFRPDVAMTDPDEWFNELWTNRRKGVKHRDLFDRVAKALKVLLLLKGKEEITVEKKKVIIYHTHKYSETLAELSEGYRSIIAIAVDIMKVIVNSGVSMEAAQGIVLIDEIGTHLHPVWRMQVVDRFRNVFPQMQFIVTTHDPLCLRGMKKGEIAVFTKDRKHKIHVRTDLPDPAGFSAEQLLSSQFFGLNSTKDPEVVAAFDDYYYLLSRKSLSPSQQKKLIELKNYLRDKQQLGNSEREEMLLVATDAVLAESKANKTPTDRFKLEEETITAIKKVYNTPVV